MSITGHLCIDFGAFGGICFSLGYIFSCSEQHVLLLFGGYLQRVYYAILDGVRFPGNGLGLNLVLGMGWNGEWGKGVQNKDSSQRSHESTFIFLPLCILVVFFFQRLSAFTL